MAGSDGLTTGYGPGVPLGDNLLNDFVQENAASFAGFGRARGDRVVRTEGIGTLIDAGSPLPFSNRAVLERPVGDLSFVVDHVRAFYDGEGDTPSCSTARGRRPISAMSGSSSWATRR